MKKLLITSMLAATVCLAGTAVADNDDKLPVHPLVQHPTQPGWKILSQPSQPSKPPPEADDVDKLPVLPVWMQLVAGGPEPSKPPPNFYVSSGYSFVGTKGFEFAVGVQAKVGDLIVVRASPNVILTYGETEGYYVDTFSNGQSRCRNESNGQFATDESCNGSGLDYRVDADAYIHLHENFLVGGGFIHTLHSDFTPERDGVTDSFLAIMFKFDNKQTLELRGGADYTALRLRGDF